MNNRFLLVLATLVGTMIGAGIFGLPYVVSKSGIIPGLFYFIVLGGIVTILHLMFGEIALRTTEKHRLIGYAKLYLGDWAKVLVSVSTIGGVVGALLAYLIIAGEFLEIIVSPWFVVSQTTLSVLFWAVLSLFILRGIQAIAKMELLMSSALFLVVGLIFVLAVPHIGIENFSLVDSANIFLPYGVVMFAFLGLSAIPEIADLFKGKKEKQNFDNVIVWASVITGSLYILFTLFVIGVSGKSTTDDALSGLVPFLGTNIAVLGSIFGLIAIAASFLVLGNYLKNSLRYDYKAPYLAAAAVAIFTPLVLFLLGIGRSRRNGDRADL
jgi:tyrosine-specific transport protein